MNDDLSRFEGLVRRAGKLSAARMQPTGGMHPFDERRMHPGLPEVVRALFNDGHYAQATFEAHKFVDGEVRRHACSDKSGFSLMMDAFNEDRPLIRLNSLSSESEKDEQRGSKFLFAGAMSAVRNPRGHEYAVVDSPDTCLDHLSLASLLLRRLDEARARETSSVKEAERRRN